MTERFANSFNALSFSFAHDFLLKFRGVVLSLLIC